MSQTDTEAQLIKLNAQFDLAEQGATLTHAPIEGYPADTSDPNHVYNQYDNGMPLWSMGFFNQSDLSMKKATDR